MKDKISQPYSGGKNTNPIIPSWVTQDAYSLRDDPICECGHYQSSHDLPSVNSLAYYECDYSKSKIVNCKCKKFEVKKE